LYSKKKSLLLYKSSLLLLVWKKPTTSDFYRFKDHIYLSFASIRLALLTFIVFLILEYLINSKHMEKNTTLYGALLASCTRYPNRTALIYMSRKISYVSLLSKVNGLAQGLFDYGVRANDVISVCLPNIPSAVHLLYASISSAPSLISSIH
jgi:hypothetical protein